MLVFPVRQTCQVKNLGYISHQTLPLGLHQVSPLTARKDVTLQKHQWLGAVAVLAPTPSKRRCGGRGGMHHQTGPSLFEADKRWHQYSGGGVRLTSEIYSSPVWKSKRAVKHTYERINSWLHQWISRGIPPLCRKKYLEEWLQEWCWLRRHQHCNLAWCKGQGCRIRGWTNELHTAWPCFDLLVIFSNLT